MEPHERPPIGFILEGRGEYVSYPSLVCRILGTEVGRIPRNEVRYGCGEISANLDEHLLDLVRVAHPYVVIVTVDLVDFKDQFADCVALIDHIQSRANDWLERMRTHPKIAPLPQYIKVVLQIKKFEGWLSSDDFGLSQNGLLAQGYTPCFYTDTDTEIREPHGHLCEILNDLDPKDTEDVKKIVAALRVDVVEHQSRSFRKFAKEVRASYELWQNACAI